MKQISNRWAISKYGGWRGDANDFKPKNERRSLLSDQQQQSDLGKASFKTA